MRRGILLLTLAGAILLACTGLVLAQQNGSAPPRSSSSEVVAPGEILVKFKKGTSRAKKQDTHERKGGKREKVISGIGVEVVAVTEGEEKSKAKEYQDDPNVKYAEVNGVREAFANTPDDPRASEQWQFNNTQYDVTNKGDIDAYEAWNGGSTTDWDGGTTGSNSVAIAILDSGIKEDHEDLQGKVTKRQNFTDSSTNSDLQGHGTHVAGSAAALTNNAKGVAGTCPGCSLYNAKVLNDTGVGLISWEANGIIWAADNGAKVINMSLGGPGTSSTEQDAVNYAWSKGVVVVAAAGNDNTSILNYPAAYPNTIAVGATDSNDAKASFSNYGSSWVDVAAPGVNILSTTINGGYGSFDGTSMASPHVAGEAGLLWSKSGLCGATDNTCVRNQIESKADQTAGTGTNWAKGRINANGGLSGGTTPPPPEDTAPPETTITSGPSGTVGSTSATFGFSSSESGSTFECRLDGTSDSDWGPCTSSKEYTDLASGSHTFEVRAKDPAGNTDPSPASRTWTIEPGTTEPPTDPPTSGKKITICHKDHVTITVSSHSWAAHESHGDEMGSCSTSSKKKE
jgi:thermitase